MYLLETIFIKLPYHERKKKHLFSINTLSHTTRRIVPWKIRKIPPSCLEKQPNFSLPCYPRHNLLG
jgi:hypothetical protein